MMVWLIGFIHEIFIQVPAVSYSVLVYEIGITTPLGLFWDEKSWNTEALKQCLVRSEHRGLIVITCQSTRSAPEKQAI